jgi:glyoxylase-like metal-dependent hydrolase (beta-lactamase superfamily II)
MRRVGPNSFTEIYFAGCNPSFIETSDGYVMIDSPQQPIDAVRWREQLEEKAPIRYLINTEPHGDHISGNAYFTKTTVVGQVKLQECFDRYLNAFGSLEDKRERYKQMDPDSVWLVGHPDYPASNPPSLTFTDTLTLNVGNHTFNIIHHPGHTAPQTSVHVPEEGVVFTGDNVFHKCRSWLQECDPWEWLDALDRIAALDVEIIVPGHGEPCSKAYLKEQAQIVENWVGFVERHVERGASPEEILKEGVPVTQQDPYPIGQRLFMHDERLTGLIVHNLHKRILGKKEAAGTRAG